jgi:hypothetical protein
MEILGCTPDSLITLVEKGIQLLHLRSLDIEGGYGYFTVFDDTADFVGAGLLLVCQINICPPDDAEMYLNISQEQAKRLFSRKEDVSSFQSRNPETGKWGGAIRAAHSILSFSGLSEMANEALMVFVARKAIWPLKTDGWISQNEADLIAHISRNPYIHKIIE